MQEERYQLIGRIRDAHGLKGEVKVVPLTSWPDRFIGLERCFLGGSPGMRAIRIETARLQGAKFVLVKFEGVDDRGAAEKLKGLTVNVLKSERMPLEEGQFYLDDLIGCLVVDQEGAELGRVKDFSEQGGCGLLVVAVKGGGLVDVPFVDRYVAGVDVEAGSIVVTPAWSDLLDLDGA